MKITDVIKILESIKEEHGDLDCYKYLGYNIVEVNDYNSPKIKEIIKPTSRESTIKFKDKFSYKDREVLKKACLI